MVVDISKKNTYEMLFVVIIQVKCLNIPQYPSLDMRMMTLIMTGDDAGVNNNCIRLFAYLAGFQRFEKSRN